MSIPRKKEAQQQNLLSKVRIFVVTLPYTRLMFGGTAYWNKVLSFHFANDSLNMHMPESMTSPYGLVERLPLSS